MRRQLAAVIKPEQHITALRKGFGCTIQITAVIIHTEPLYGRARIMCFYQAQTARWRVLLVLEVSVLGKYSSRPRDGILDSPASGIARHSCVKAV